MRVQRTPAAGDVLVIKLGALGDVALSLAHIARIVESFPGGRVTLLTAPEYRELADGIAGLEVVAFPRKGYTAMWRLLRWLLGRRFRVVFDLQGSARSRIMTLLTQAERRIGRTPASAYTDVPVGQEESAHAVSRINALLAVAGVAPPAAGSVVMPRGRPAAAVSTWLEARLPGKRKLVLMHAGSSRRWPSKRWEEAHFIELARRLQARGISVIWIGGEDDRELNQRLARETGVDASGAFTCVDLVTLGSRAAFAITGDSGPMHVLSLSGIPVYAFFGPTDWQRSHALGQQDNVLSNPVPCSPCHLGICPPAHRHECLADITADRVIARLQADRLLD